MTPSLLRAVVLADVSRSYAAHRRRVGVFRNFELAVTCGERLAVVGPNGSGKSTLLRLIAGLVLADAGFVRVRDACGTLVDPALAPGTCAAVLEGGRGLHGRLTLRENAHYLGALDGVGGMAAERALDPWLERLGLARRLDDLVQSFSKGTQQKAAIALALACTRPVLLLDEPTTLLDEDACNELAVILRERCAVGQTVIVATHDHAWRAQIQARSVVLPAGAATQASGPPLPAAPRSPAGSAI